MRINFGKTRTIVSKKTSTAEVVEDYDIYIMSTTEKLINTFVAAVVIYFIAFIFYRSHILSLLLIPISLCYPRMKTRSIILKRKKELNLQFKDMLYSLSSSLAAGKSIELSFRDVLEDLEILYPGADENIIKEVGYIVKRLEMNETIESVLLDFANRAKLEDVDNFVDVFYTCKRTGGNLVEIVASHRKCQKLSSNLTILFASSHKK